VVGLTYVSLFFAGVIRTRAIMIDEDRDSTSVVLPVLMGFGIFVLGFGVLIGLARVQQARNAALRKQSDESAEQTRLATTKDDYSLETYVLGTDHYQIELLTNLDKVPEAGAIAVVAFPKPKGGSGFPARVFAIVP